MSINEVVAAYLEEKANESAAKKRAEAMKKLILQHAGTADSFQTDIYTVIIKTTSSVRLDTDSLYKDFPDIKNDYGKITTSRTISAAVTGAAGQKTA